METPTTPTWKDHVDFIMQRGSVDNMVVISSENGDMWCSSDPDGFHLKQYKATITKDDGSEVEEMVDEAKSILTFMNSLSGL